VDNFYSIGVWV